MSDLLFGDHRAQQDPLPPVAVGITRSPVPSGWTRKRSWAPPGRLTWSNAIQRPSGDQRAVVVQAVVGVIRRGREPSAFVTYTALSPSRPAAPGAKAANATR